MKEEDKKQIISSVADTIMELPISYKAGGQDFYMYPPSIGISMLVERLLDGKLSPTDAKQGLIGTINAIRKERAIAVKVAALCSFENRKDATKEPLLIAREKEIEKAKDEVLVRIILRFLSYQSEYMRFFKYFGLDREKMDIQRCYSSKDSNDGSILFNCKSIYGTMIDVACERYGKKERQKAGVSADRNVINMDKGNVDKSVLLSLMKR